MIITLVGGGSTFTPGIVKSIIQKEKELGVSEVRLYDINKERQDKVAVIVKWIIENQLKSSVKLTVTTDKQEAYQDAKFIFSQMRVGGYKMREQDEKIPLKHGCVGQETCGAGGLAYGMRTLFPMIDLIDDVEKYAAKDHWILNYSNPASIVSEGCRLLRPNARIINICDMPIAIIAIIGQCLGIKDHNAIDYDYFGLNHFGWFTKMSYEGRDVLEEIKTYVKEHRILLPKEIIDRISDPTNVNRHANQSWIHVWKSVYEMLELFPEYLPNTYMNYYLLPKESVEHSDPNKTRANEVMDAREADLFKGIEKYLETGEVDAKTFYAGDHGDWIADLAIAIKNDTKRKYLVIVPNNGALENIDDDVMVEVPAYLGKNGPEVIKQEAPKRFYQTLIMQQANCEKLLIEGMVEGSYRKVLEAFTINRTIPSAKVAKEILDDMIIANKDYWPILK